MDEPQRPLDGAGAEAVGATAAAAQQPAAPVDKRSRSYRTWVAVLLSLLVVGGGVAFLVTDSLQSAQFYRTIAEVHGNGAALQGKRFRVAGRVVPGSLSAVGAGVLPEHRFRLADGGLELAVRYGKALPDAFTDDVEVVVAGGLLPSGEFAADELLARCPSKYEARRTPKSMAPAAAGHPAEVPRQGVR